MLELTALPLIVALGSCPSSLGKLIGNRPQGFTSPNKTRAIASPPRAPGYHASMTAAVRESHGIHTGPTSLKYDHRALVGSGDFGD